MSWHWNPSWNRWGIGRGGDEWHRRPFYVGTPWGLLLVYLRRTNPGPRHPSCWVNGVQSDTGEVFRPWCAMCRSDAADWPTESSREDKP